MATLCLFTIQESWRMAKCLIHPLQKEESPLSFSWAKEGHKGWEMGIKGMCIGEKRKLIIPPHLGYGARGVENVIPPNSVLIFTTELMAIKRKSLFDPKLLLQIAFWPILAGLILYYLYKKATKESTKHEAKASKKNKKK
ncbi:hypothetical protein OS493_022163 [Desmophyllum pertusum]|uniref:peptidylprolyl isomerase n=1 Tax=Desmophyllum pertusum TaxID=174260 RepID=A0A9W9YQH3_9CNID|nr:hypothetical protein OS493_022163 [Desmophyllum pertusum]